jgi:protein-disulfide isomerase
MSRLRQPVSADDHVRGDPRAPVTVIEYGDYECPSCRRGYFVVEEVLRRVGGDVLYAFRHFPLTQVHPHALMAAYAAEAAGAQGAFWAMHAMLYDNQTALELPELLVYARDLGLDVDRYAEELGCGVYDPKVKADFRSGVRSGVNGTPTFFLDGARFDVPWNADSLTSAIVRARDVVRL